MIQVCDAIMGNVKSSATKTYFLRDLAHVSMLLENKVLTSIENLVSHSLSTVYNNLARSQNGEKHILAKSPITTAFLHFYKRVCFIQIPLLMVFFLISSFVRRMARNYSRQNTPKISTALYS